MGTTFGATWDSPKMKGRMVNDEGYASDQFIEWSIGTAHLVDENWAYGFERIVQKMRADIAHQRDPFPPQTPAIFCAMCFPPELTGNQITQAAGQASQSFKEHPNLIAKVEREKRIAADPEYAERKKKAGNETLSNLKDMF